MSRANPAGVEAGLPAGEGRCLDPEIGEDQDPGVETDITGDAAEVETAEGHGTETAGGEAGVERDLAVGEEAEPGPEIGRGMRGNQKYSQVRSYSTVLFVNFL